MLTDTAEKVESVTAAIAPGGFGPAAAGGQADRVVPTEASRAPVMLQDVTKRYGRRRGAVAALDRVSPGRT